MPVTPQPISVNLRDTFSIPTNSALNFFNALPKQTKNIFDAINSGLDSALAVKATKQKMQLEQQQAQRNAIKDNLTIQKDQLELKNEMNRDVVRTAITRNLEAGNIGPAVDLFLTQGSILPAQEYKSLADSLYGITEDPALLSRANRVSLSKALRASGKASAELSAQRNTFKVDFGLSQEAELLGRVVNEEGKGYIYTFRDGQDIKKFNTAEMPNSASKFLEKEMLIVRNNEKNQELMQTLAKADLLKDQVRQLTFDHNRADNLDEKNRIASEMAEKNREYRSLMEQTLSESEKAKIIARKITRENTPLYELTPPGGVVGDVSVPSTDQVLSGNVIKKYGLTENHIKAYTTPDMVKEYKMRKQGLRNMTYDDFVALKIRKALSEKRKKEMEEARKAKEAR